ncbi:MAG: restriction endonuclease subunit S [Acidaminococcaceae bacterium]|nr:restriction endonuclease subunit S [Acidaminococcaceae bacterium]
MKYKFSDVCDVINGRAYSQDELLNKGKYRVLRVGNFFTRDKWYFSDLELEADKYCNEGDLLFAWSASFGPKIWHGEKVIYHYHIWKLLPKAEMVDKTYLYFWLLFSTNKLMSGNHGSVMAHMTKGEMENREITLPPLV